MVGTGAHRFEGRRRGDVSASFPLRGFDVAESPLVGTSDSRRLLGRVQVADQVEPGPRRVVVPAVQDVQLAPAVPHRLPGVPEPLAAGGAQGSRFGGGIEPAAFDRRPLGYLPETRHQAER